MTISNITGLLDYDRFIISDDPEANIPEYFDRSIKFIEKNLSRGEKVLVQCQAGISRSATIISAYLIKKYGISVKRSYCNYFR